MCINVYVYIYIENVYMFTHVYIYIDMYTCLHMFNSRLLTPPLLPLSDLALPTTATTAFVFRSMVPAPSDKMSSKTTKMHSCDSLEAPKDLRAGEQVGLSCFFSHSCFSY